MRLRSHLFLLLLVLFVFRGSHPVLAAGDSPRLFQVLPGHLESHPDSLSLQVDIGLIQSDPEQVQVPLPSGRTLVATRSFWQWQNSDHYSWVGEIEGSREPGSLSLYFLEGRLLGEVFPGDGSGYQLVPDGDFHRLEPIPGPLAGSCGVDHSSWEMASISAPVGASAFGGPGTSDNDCVVPPTVTQIDLMVLYPLSLSGSAQAVSDYAATRTAQANMIFSESDVKVAYNLVRVAPITGEQPPVPPPGSGARPTEFALNWLTDQFDTPALDTEAEYLRKAYGADMIALIVPPDPNLNCGIANLPELVGGVEVMFGTSIPFGNKAFSAMELNCGNGDFTFAHELGHNWGMRHHDMRNSARDILPWAYGYLIPGTPKGTISTIMACVDVATPICRRVARVSNPDRTYVGIPTGLHSSQSAQPAHNACVANLRATQYRDFAAPPPTSPPQLTITSPADGANVQPGSAFTLIASATDPEDGNLSGSVSWSSDREGNLGTGSPRTVSLDLAGRHLITASVTDSSGTKVVYSIRLDVVESDPPRRWIDQPSHDQEISGQFLVRGWATDASGVVDVSFTIDGAPVTLDGFLYGTSRADVCNVHSDLNDPNCPFVGFQGTLDTTAYSNGTHVLRGTFTDFFDNTSTLDQTFRIENIITRSFAPTADAWVSEEDPDENYGDDLALFLRASGSNLAKHVYMKFTVSGVTRPVQNATLRLRARTDLDGLRIYWIQTTSWQEDTITWNNAPLDPLLNFPTSSHEAGDWIDIDVSSIVSGNGTYTIGMVSPDTPDQSIFSREFTLFRPSLRVTY